MDQTFLAVGTPFLVIGISFLATGDVAVGTTFLALGTAFLVLAAVTGRDDERGHDGPEDAGDARTGRR